LKQFSVFADFAKCDHSDFYQQSCQVQIVNEEWSYCLSAMKALGAQCVFTKPFGKKELLEAVHELLDSVAVR
jgi:cell fate (sporulation/competence/biofilm development) regulator YmcA (YheA/YmcA/DUF963 family)